MTQYINKDALMAEIEKRLHANGAFDTTFDTAWAEDVGMCNAYKSILSFIDTLEVKEVNLEEEIANYINRHYHIKFDETLERGNDLLTTIDFEEIAKYFFELGLKAQKGE